MEIDKIIYNSIVRATKITQAAYCIENLIINAKRSRQQADDLWKNNQQNHTNIYFVLIFYRSEELCRTEIYILPNHHGQC